MEINPFHNGHKYFLKQIPKKDEDILVAVISTSITQRGEISILDKRTKTKLLLKNNVDFVLELPSVLANQGGYYFAKHAIELLKKIGITDLYFGSETNDLAYLKKIAQKNITQKDFKNGLYKDELKDLKANDILGLSYLKQLNNTNITAHMIKRIDNNYHEKNITGKISSATAIRNNLDNYQMINDTLPKESYQAILQPNLDILWVLFQNNLEYCLDEKINIFLSEDMQMLYKFKNIIRVKHVNSLEQLIHHASDKNNSKNKLNRIVINVILLIIKDNYEISYIHLLGFNKNKQKILKQHQNLVITSLKNETDNISKIENRATLLFNMLNKQNIMYDYMPPVIYEKGEK